MRLLGHRHLPATTGCGRHRQPNRNHLILDQGGTHDEAITVTVPANAAIPKADVYFLADTTSSMGDILGAVQVGANNILA